MRNDVSIDALVADLRSVRPRSPWRDAAVLAGVAGAELALWLLLGFARPDFAEAMRQPPLSWKLASLLPVALLGVAAAIGSLTPERSPRPGLRWTAIAIGTALLVAAVLGVGVSSWEEAVTRLHWRHGLERGAKMMALSVPPAIAFALIARRGAPTEVGGTALAGALGAAGWGAFVFAFACPSDDPLYIAVWYLVGCGLTALVGRIVIARVTRW